MVAIFDKSVRKIKSPLFLSLPLAEMYEMMMMQNAQMHQMIMQQLMLSALPKQPVRNEVDVNKKVSLDLDEVLSVSFFFLTY